MNNLDEPITEMGGFTKNLAEWLNTTLTSWGVSESFMNVTKLVVLLAFAIIIVALFEI